LFGIYVSDILSGFRAVTKKGFEKLSLESRGYGVETEMIVKIARYKLKNTEVPIRTIYHDKN
jgi:dolichol-phosphate hexosyltransferase